EVQVVYKHFATQVTLDSEVVQIEPAVSRTVVTRLLKHRGAGSVLGVDLSEGMIELARKQEAAAPLGIEYQVGDGRKLPFEGEFDLVVAAYLLNYAETREQLQEMCDSIAKCLKPGGRFVTVNSNPACDFRTAPSYRKYGFETSAADPWQAGSPITWRFYLDGAEFSLENYFLSPALHEEVFRAADFREVHWRPTEVSKEGREEFDPTFWDVFLDAPPVAFIECKK
ncbi:class I SAM-dependent methyltransferase, partial [Planctomicrobium piriforme]